VYLFFIDDARQRTCARPGVGRLIAVGGAIIPAENARALDRALDKLCTQDFGFPAGEVFKWSPAPDHWMRNSLVAERRQEFFLAALATAARMGVQVQVTIADETRGMATGRAPNHELDTILLAMERLDGRLRSTNKHGVVIAARPGGGRADEDRFLAKCVEMLTLGTQYVAFDRLAANVLTTTFGSSRLLQLADLTVSCTTALVAGHTGYAGPIFPAIRAMMLESGGRIGGVGLKLHPDFIFVNLYHWLLGDDAYWRMNMGVSLPMRGRPYLTGPDAFHIRYGLKIGGRVVS
jgi:hypothetical protein